MAQQDNSTSGYTSQDADMLDTDRRAEIPLFDGLSLLPDGSWYGIERPLATGYVMPGRGHEGHGADNDTTIKDWEPDQSGEIPLMEEQYDPANPGWADLVMSGPPLLVSVVPAPLKIITKGTQTRTIIDGSFNFTTAAFSGPDTVDGIVQGLSRDESRTQVRFRVENNYAVAAASQSAQYVFAISHDPNFIQYVVLGTQTGTFSVENTEPLFVTIIPIAARDATKQNTLVLQAIVETQSILDTNPSAKSGSIRSNDI